MRSVISRFYLFGAVVSIIVALGLLFQFCYFRNILTNEAETLTTQFRDLSASEINSRLVSKGQVIEDAADYMSIEKWDQEELLGYFKKLMNSNPMFYSIYFGSADNVMINGSGWVMPQGFDLRIRPWYVKAVQENRLIFTEAFINASNDRLIITIAKPVFASDGHHLGVVAGDVSIKDIISAVNSKKINELGYSFLIDGKGNILAHPNYEYSLTSVLKNINEVSKGVDDLMLQNSSGRTKVSMDGKEGYLAYRSIENTDWAIGSFIPLDKYMKGETQFFRIFIITLVSSLFVFSILLRLLNKHLVKPMALLEKDVEKINIEESISYRLPLEEKDHFGMVRKSMNTALNKAQEYFYELDLEKEKLKESMERNNAIVNAMPDMLFIIDHKGHIADLQGNAETPIVKLRDKLIGKTVWDVAAREAADICFEKISATLKTGLLQSFEYEQDASEGKRSYEFRMVKSREDEVIAISRDITERKRMEQKLDYLSYHDQLTGLYNRRFFEEELSRLDVKRNLPLTLAMADVNGLKLINDSFGHKTGDELLVKTAQVIKKGCRTDDIISRIGGDEFVILLPHTDADDAGRIVERIRDLSAGERVASIDLSISFGWDAKLNEDTNVLEILKKAEDNMYARKLFEGPSMRSKTITTILHTLHEKNKREEQHSKRVSLICRDMGSILGMSEEEIIELQNVGLLHDIGKIAIDEAILNKPGRVSEEEWNEIRRHPEIGYRILNTSSDMAQMAELVLAHHERWDGKGYPKGLKGREIPLKARIIAIADSYDAMISDRAYRKALPEEKVAEEFKINAGTQFDPDLARIFVKRIMGREW
jgi:diguanylate cyclase (GGDEF)-like protein/PAS domain S-box-containing protein